MTGEAKLEQAVKAFVGASLGDLLWYGLLACGVWLFFYVAFRTAWKHRRISQKDPARWQIMREIVHSLRSIAIFGLVTGAVVYAANSGWTQLYRRIDKCGWVWFFLSIGVMIVMHDTYFYWTHRMMHHRWLYRTFHRTHHLSTNPTPWAAYAFSPLEAVVQAGIGPLIVFTIPVHPIAFATFMLWQIAFNVFGHCGYEIFPSWFLRSRASLFLNTVTHHALHHEKFRDNFSLYFNVWDRLMGTNHTDYAYRFELATVLPPVEELKQTMATPVAVRPCEQPVGEPISGGSAGHPGRNSDATRVAVR